MQELRRYTLRHLQTIIEGIYVGYKYYETAAPAFTDLGEPYVSEYHLNSNFDKTTYLKDDDVMPTTGADNGLTLADNGHGFMNADAALENGVDAMLSTFNGDANNVADPTHPTSVLQMRNACKKVMYTVVSSWAYDGEHEVGGIPAAEKYYL